MRDNGHCTSRFTHSVSHDPTANKGTQLGLRRRTKLRPAGRHDGGHDDLDTGDTTVEAPVPRCCNQTLGGKRKRLHFGTFATGFFPIRPFRIKRVFRCCCASSEMIRSYVHLGEIAAMPAMARRSRMSALPPGGRMTQTTSL